MAVLNLAVITAPGHVSAPVNLIQSGTIYGGRLMTKWMEVGCEEVSEGRIREGDR